MSYLGHRSVSTIQNPRLAFLALTSAHKTFILMIQPYVVADDVLNLNANALFLDVKLECATM